jgi:hypothetical protein
MATFGVPDTRLTGLATSLNTLPWCIVHVHRFVRTMLIYSSSETRKVLPTNSFVVALVDLLHCFCAKGKEIPRKNLIPTLRWSRSPCDTSLSPRLGKIPTCDQNMENHKISQAKQWYFLRNQFFLVCSMKTRLWRTVMLHAMVNLFMIGYYVLCQKYNYQIQTKFFLV